MKKEKDPPLCEFKFHYHFGDETQLWDKYFVAVNLDSATEMFNYSCRRREIKPLVSKVEQWNRWIDKWEIVSEETVPSWLNSEHRRVFLHVVMASWLDHLEKKDRMLLIFSLVRSYRLYPNQILPYLFAKVPMSSHRLWENRISFSIKFIESIIYPLRLGDRRFNREG